MSTEDAAPTWIVGCGDVGCRLALRQQAAGQAVLGMTRSIERLAQLRRLRIPHLRCDLDGDGHDDEPLPPGAPAALVYCAPPPSSGVTDTRLRQLLARLPAPPPRLLYLSTSGVYGDCGGDWVDEQRPPQPAHDRARRRLDAETALRAYTARHRVTAVILRVPGIYGPGRLPLARLRAGQPLLRPEQSPWSNHVHADDLADLAQRALQRPLAPGETRLYNAGDGAPDRMTDYLLRCAVVLGLPAPPLADYAAVYAAASPMLREFLGESKRLDNRRAQRELGWRPRRLDGADGLAGCLQPDAVVAAAQTAD